MSWPAYALTEADDYAVRDGNDVSRTQFEDGAVRQSREHTEAFTARAIRVHLKDDADYASFRAWARANAHAWFAWTDPDDGVRRRVRVRGGAGGIEYRARARAGRRSWTARCALEGLWSDTV